MPVLLRLLLGIFGSISHKKSHPGLGGFLGWVFFLALRLEATFLGIIDAGLDAKGMIFLGFQALGTQARRKRSRLPRRYCGHGRGARC